MATAVHLYHLFLELLIPIFAEVIDEFLQYPHPLDYAQNLLLKSKTVSAIVEPILYRRIKEPFDRMKRCLCRTIPRRPELAALVRQSEYRVLDCPCWPRRKIKPFVRGRPVEEDDDEGNERWYHDETVGDATSHERNQFDC